MLRRGRVCSWASSFKQYLYNRSKPMQKVEGTDRSDKQSYIFTVDRPENSERPTSFDMSPLGGLASASAVSPIVTGASFESLRHGLSAVSGTRQISAHIQWH
jgi:hypothetical protein